MRKAKWLTTAISVCIVATLILGTVTGTSATVTIQQGGEYTFYDDFADNDASGWSKATESGGQLVVNTGATSESQNFTGGPADGSFVLEGKITVENDTRIRFFSSSTGFLELNYRPQYNRTELRSGGGIDIDQPVVFDPGTTTQFKIEYDASAGTYSAETLGESMSGTAVKTNWNRPLQWVHGGNNDNILVDWVGYKQVGEGLIAGNVTDSNGQPIQNATVTLRNTTTGQTNTTQTDSFGEFQFRKEFGRYNVSAAKEDYVGVEKQVPYDSQNKSFGRVTLTLQRESERLRFDAPSFLKHGAEGDYRAAANVGDDWQNVTENITVTSNNPNIVTLNSERKVLIATSNVSRNGNTTVNVEWTDPETGETLELSHKVTVANLTVDNLDILPPTQKFSAVIGGGTDQNPADKSYLSIFLATALASAVSLIATVTAGLAIIPVVLFAAMIVGFVEIQVVIAATLVCIFLGLNIGQNIDYGVR
jgi:hypothetical protein